MPSITVNLANTTFVSSAQPYSNFNFFPVMYIGTDSTYQNSSGLLQFVLPTIPALWVDSAVMQFSLILKNQATPTVVTVNRATSAFDTNTVTYATQPAFTPTASQVSVTQSDLYLRVSFDITTLVNSWLAGTYPNYGIVLTSSDDAVQFATNAITYQPYFPTLTLTYSSTPPSGNGAFCFCYAQLANVIQQLMVQYPTSVMRIYTTGDIYSEGIPYKFYASPDASYGTLAVLTGGGVYDTIPITTIVAVRVAGTNYDNPITYLPPPVFTPDCQKNVVTSIHDYLPVSTSVKLSLNGFVTVSGVVYKNEYGILAITKDMTGASPVFLPVTSVALIETSVPLPQISPPAFESAQKKSKRRRKGFEINLKEFRIGRKKGHD